MTTLGTRLRALAAPLLGPFIATLLLVACGGGGGVGTGGTGSFASGPITGFGSVIVNDIRFEVSDATTAVDDGDDVRRDSAALKLGMTVEIDSDGISGGTARASRIRFDSALLGPVDAIDAAGGTFTMLGQTVAVDETTVFDERLSGRLALLLPGSWVEVYALYDPATLRFRATRIEARLVQPLFYRIRGVAQEVDPRAQTLRIGRATFGYAGALNVPAGLAGGQFVRLLVRTAAPVGGVRSVAAFRAALPSVGELDAVSVKGLVDRFDSAASFQVDGRPVDASAASVEGTPVLGARVEVEGAVRGGVLRARSVKVSTDAQERERGFELRGAIEAVGATLPRSFVVRGVSVNTNRTDLRFDNGSAADLAVGRRVQVRGVVSDNGTGLEATRIRFE